MLPTNTISNSFSSLSPLRVKTWVSDTECGGKLGELWKYQICNLRWPSCLGLYSQFYHRMCCVFLYLLQDTLQQAMWRWRSREGISGDSLRPLGQGRTCRIGRTFWDINLCCWPVWPQCNMGQHAVLLHTDNFSIKTCIVYLVSVMAERSFSKWYDNR